jgi:hypothetical protein
MRPLIHTLLLFMVIVPFTALAENNLPAEIREVNAEINSPAGYALIGIALQPLPPDGPAPKKVIDKKLVAVMATLGGPKVCVSSLTNWFWTMSILPVRRG